MVKQGTVLVRQRTVPCLTCFKIHLELKSFLLNFVI